MVYKNGFRVWDEEFERELYTSEEIQENNIQAQLMCELIRARQEKNVSQRDLKEMPGIAQSTIARIESGATVPSLTTLIKILAPLGKTLAIVPITKN